MRNRARLHLWCWAFAVACSGQNTASDPVPAGAGATAVGRAAAQGEAGVGTRQFRPTTDAGATPSGSIPGPADARSNAGSSTASQPSGSTQGSGSAAGQDAVDASASAGASGGSGSTAGTAGASGAGLGSSLAQSTAAGSGGAAPAAGGRAQGPDCDVDPLASEEPYGSGFFQQFIGLFGCTVPADLALFRELLPDKLEMPVDPKVCFYTIDFQISGVGPYHEAAILLPTTYKGKTGSYVLTMGLDSSAATSGGRALGFPKYLGQVALEQHGHDWVGTVSAQGSVDLKAVYTGECRQSDEFLWPDFFNLTPIPAGTSSNAAFLPPRTGDVLRVPAEYLEPPAFYSLKGSVRLEINDALPWNGLVDESRAFPGLLTSFVGGIDLGNQPLDGGR